MADFDGAGEAWCLLDEPWQKRARERDSTSILQRADTSSHEEASNVFVEEAICSCSARGGGYDPALVCWHCAPLDCLDDQRTPDSATSSDSYEGSASPVWARTPSDERPLKKARSPPPESSPQADGAARAGSYAARLCDAPQEKPRAPHDYGHAAFVRHDASPADPLELGTFSFFPHNFSKTHASLQPQT
ncbi:hypothetical protein T484DRAFT_3639305 [Baffinella frigidus]|nr:hypothetical protein T484DRAFT_3639305 [Cryptophyta sp. CCMP2293]